MTAALRWTGEPSIRMEYWVGGSQRLIRAMKPGPFPLSPAARIAS